MPRVKQPRYTHYITNLSHRECAQKCVALEGANERLKRNNSDLRKQVEYLALSLAMNDLEENGPDDNE